MVNDVVFVGLDDLVRDRRFVVGGDWNTARQFDEHWEPPELSSLLGQRAGGGSSAWIPNFQASRKPGSAREMLNISLITFCDDGMAARKTEVRVATEAAKELRSS